MAGPFGASFAPIASPDAAPGGAGPFKGSSSQDALQVIRFDLPRTISANAPIANDLAQPHTTGGGADTTVLASIVRAMLGPAAASSMPVTSAAGLPSEAWSTGGVSVSGAQSPQASAQDTGPQAPANPWGTPQITLGQGAETPAPPPVAPTLDQPIAPSGDAPAIDRSTPGPFQREPEAPVDKWRVLHRMFGE